MSKQIINIGNSANDGNGEPARSAFNKVNANFSEVYTALGGGLGTIPSALPITSGGTGAATAPIARLNLDVYSKSETYYRKVASGTDLNSVTAGNSVGFFGFESAATNTPTSAATGHFWNFRPIQWARSVQMWNPLENNPNIYYRMGMDSSFTAWFKFLSTGNTTVDSNGFIKAASPIVQLYSDKIELNDEAKEQSITFERVDVGHYLVKGSSGFATEGWYIEQPKDANGNLYHVVEIATHENGDLDIKTYDYMLDKKGRIVADHDTPLDIYEGRWIDIRLQEVPKPVPEMPTEEVNSDEPQQ